MKNLIITGIALLFLNQASAGTSKSIANEQGASFRTDTVMTGGKLTAPVEDQGIMNPAMVFESHNERPMEAIIAENNAIVENSLENNGSLIYIEKSIEEIIQDDNKIIESAGATEIHPLYLDRTIEDKIAEDNAIIESRPMEAQPLNFEASTQKPLELKKENNPFMG